MINHISKEYSWLNSIAKIIIKAKLHCEKKEFKDHEVVMRSCISSVSKSGNFRNLQLFNLLQNVRSRITYLGCRFLFIYLCQ